jgi:tetratricopeptide (TPR) repeat protein
MLGQVIHGYRVDRALSVDKGGFGDVFFATHVESGAEAVVKVLKPEMSAHRDIVTRFFNEARAAASIHHPGIVQIHNVGYHGDRAYLLMEKLRGDDLETRLKAGPLPLDRSIVFMRQTAGAIAAAHERGIVHRDLKPANLFIVRDPDVMGGERVKVLDFGIAKLSLDAGGGKTQGVFGTPAYMSPEQCASAGAVDARSDLYALGCIFYELVCGRPPFGHGGIELIAAHLRDTPPSPRSLAPWLPPAVEAVILQLLEKNPAQRLASCNALIAALDGVAATLQTGATPWLPQHAGAAPHTSPSPPFAAPSTLGGAARAVATMPLATPVARTNRGVMFALIGVAAAGIAAAIAVMAAGGGNDERAAGRVAAAGGFDAAAPVPPAPPVDAAEAEAAPLPPVVDAGTTTRRGGKVPVPPPREEPKRPDPPPREEPKQPDPPREEPKQPDPPPREVGNASTTRPTEMPPVTARNANTLNTEGKAFMRDRQYGEAAARFRQAYALDPQPKYLFNLAVTLYQEGKCGESITALNQVLSSRADDELKEKARSVKAKAAACGQ